MAAAATLAVFAHSRFDCPTARSQDIGIKGPAPCGSDNGVFSGTPLTIAPGPLTITLSEGVAHRGAGWRISLSGDGDDSTQCPLLDHIPHDETSRPTYRQEETYHQLHITIEIPDVSCERCSLHMSNPMTDKIGGDGSPSGVGCTEPGSCFSVYYSCTQPLRITGSTPRGQYSCPGGFPADWPTSWTGDGGAPVAATTAGTYRRESARWEDGWLLDAPPRYRQPAGMCMGDAPVTSSPPPPPWPPPPAPSPPPPAAAVPAAAVAGALASTLTGTKIADAVVPARRPDWRAAAAATATVAAAAVASAAVTAAFATAVAAAAVAHAVATVARATDARAAAARAEYGAAVVNGTNGASRLARADSGGRRRRPAAGRARGSGGGRRRGAARPRGDRRVVRVQAKGAADQVDRNGGCAEHAANQ